MTQLGKFQSKDFHPDRGPSIHPLYGSLRPYQRPPKEALKVLSKIAQPYPVFCNELMKIIYKLTSIKCKWPLLTGTPPFDFYLHNHWEVGVAGYILTTTMEG